MLRFQRPPDAVFQVILRESMDYSIDFIDVLIDNNEYDESRAREDMKADYPAMAKVFTPSLEILANCEVLCYDAIIMKASGGFVCPIFSSVTYPRRPSIN